MLKRKISEAPPQIRTGPGSAEISRRDFLNGFLLASGGIAVSQSAPMRVLAAQMKGSACDGAIGFDPRVLRGGDLPSAFNVAHWMRDRRLLFQSGGVTLASGCDPFEGKFSISDDPEHFDVIIVGAGLAGLSAAFYLLRRRAGTRILLLDGNDYAGGNAGRDDGAPLPVPASTAGAYCYAPEIDFLLEFYREMKIDWNEHHIPRPNDCYYFDEYTPGVRPGHRGWNIDTLQRGLKRVPYERRVVDDLLRSRESMIALDALLNDPPDRSPEQYDYLSEMTLDHYLTEVLRCDPIVSDFHTLYTIDALGGTTRQVNAHSGVSFLAGEFGDKIFTFPGGTSELARRLVAWLTGTRIQLNAVALRIDVAAQAPRSKPSVVYFKDQSFHRATAKAVIAAAQAHSTRHLIEHLVNGARKAAWDEFNTVPVVVANVALRSAAPFLELGLGFSQAWWGSRYWANFSIADWVTDQRREADRPTVLTFYGGNSAPQDELPNERMKLLQTPFGDYEESIKEDLTRIMRGSQFDYDRDVSAIFLYRWGHGMIMPAPNWVFGDVRVGRGRLDRTKAPRRVACSPLGPISFAGQHTEGTPSVESAIASGHRAALEVLARL